MRPSCGNIQPVGGDAGDLGTSAEQGDPVRPLPVPDANTVRKT